MNQEELKRMTMAGLEEDLATMETNDEEGFVAWLPLAARLAALGNPMILSQWTQVQKQSGTDLMSCLCKRAKEGIWEIDHADGLDLALALISAQDFTFFLELEKDILPDQVKWALAGWGERASMEYGDADTVEFLEDWRRRHPLPEKMLLAPIAAPLSEFEAALMAPKIELPKAEYYTWPLVSKRHQEELVHMDGTEPGDSLIDGYEYEGRLELKGGGVLVFYRTLTSRWHVRYTFQCEGFEIDSIRLGVLPGERHDETQFSVDLKIAAPARRVDMMNFPLSILTTDGRRLLLEKAL